MDDLVNNRYRLLDRIGAGGMGRVFLATDELLGRTVAIKEIAPGSAAVLREARAAARLDHPGVVRVYDVLHAPDRCWIVMEHVPSRSLHQAAPVAHREAARIGLGVLDALRAAHAAGVLHGDVKPQNVLLADDGRVVLTDFGQATVDNTGPDPAVGSPQYLAPERVRGEPSGPATDLWSLGVTLHAAVEGRSPFARDTAIGALHAVLTGPPDPPARRGPLTPVIERLLVSDPAARLTADQLEPLLRRIASRPMGFVPMPTGAAPAPTAVFPASTSALLAPTGVLSRPTGARRGLARSTKVGVALAAVLLAGTAGTALARDAVNPAPPVRASAPPADLCDDAAVAGAYLDPSPTRPGYLPTGWVPHDDPLGFRLALPPGWTRAADGRSACFRDPGSSRSLRVTASGGRYAVDRTTGGPNDHLVDQIVATLTPLSHGGTGIDRSPGAR
ncbi:protein kinase [Actinoplanes sp. NPDC049265]|uniref:serine/threonine-protein kinase n=1 Tax=Actinoplanes sp. NPDC049265 TaxID=3363902 RepID=UPI003722A818